MYHFRIPTEEFGLLIGKVGLSPMNSEVPSALPVHTAVTAVTCRGPTRAAASRSEQIGGCPGSRWGTGLSHFELVEGKKQVREVCGILTAQGPEVLCLPREKGGSGYSEKTVVGKQDPWPMCWGQIPVTFCLSSGLRYQRKLPSPHKIALSGVNYC